MWLLDFEVNNVVAFIIFANQNWL